MAWNEPGKGDKDPWGNGNRSDKGPPDIDEVMRKMQRKFAGIFGGGSSSDDGGSSNGGTAGIGLALLVAFIVWMLSGIYIIDPAEKGVVMRFGQYQEITDPGPHWHIPGPIERVEIVNVAQSRNAEIGYRSTTGRTGSGILSESLMLTKDENIVDLKIEVQYKVKDAAFYLFNVRNPDLTLRQMTESAVRETVGQSVMDFVLTEGRSEVASRTGSVLQGMLDDLETGLEVTSVNMIDVQPPEQVQSAFADVVKAREDEVRQKNEAEAYANDIVPKARGGAFRLVQEAEAYKSQIIAKAEGETSRFLQVMNEYEKAPAITSERLYLDAMESVYSQSQKVMIDVEKSSNNMLYLPLDKMRGAGSTAGRGNMSLDNMQNSSSSSNSSSMGQMPTDARIRGGR
ncbi:MAG: membrane protease subunit HflK [Methylophagaceae bacterium]|jgi:membrane protease subunit HflK